MTCWNSRRLQRLAIATRLRAPRSGLGRGTPSEVLPLSWATLTHRATDRGLRRAPWARSFGRDACAWRMSPAPGRRLAANAPDFLLGWVPLVRAHGRHRPADQPGAQIKRAARAPALARDLPARDPQLGPIAPPELAVTDGTATDAALVLDLSGPCLRFDPACLSQDQAEALKPRSKRLRQSWPICRWPRRSTRPKRHG